jgi:hypothetical protein
VERGGHGVRPGLGQLHRAHLGGQLAPQQPAPHGRALDLPARGLVERRPVHGHQHHRREAEAFGEASPDRPDHGGEVVPVRGDEHHGQPFHAVGARHAERGREALRHPVDRAGLVLDLVAVVVDAVDDDDLLGAPGDRHPAVGHEREVAGVEPVAVGERLLVGRRVVQVAGGDPLGPALQPADVELRQLGRAVLAGDPELAARRGPAHAEERRGARRGLGQQLERSAGFGLAHVLHGGGTVRLVGHGRARLGHAPREQDRALVDAVGAGRVDEPPHHRVRALLARVDQCRE